MGSVWELSTSQPQAQLLMEMGRKDPDSTTDMNPIWAHRCINWMTLHDFLEFCDISAVCKSITKGKLWSYANKYLETLWDGMKIQNNINNKNIPSRMFSDLSIKKLDLVYL